MKKKIVSLLLASAVAANLMACGAKETSSTEAVESVAATEEVTTTEEASAEQVTAEALIASLAPFDNVRTEVIVDNEIYGTLVYPEETVEAETVEETTEASTEASTEAASELELTLDNTAYYTHEYANGIVKTVSSLSTLGEGEESGEYVGDLNYTVGESRLAYREANKASDSADSSNQSWVLVENAESVEREWVIEYSGLNTSFDIAQYSEYFKDATVEDAGDKYNITAELGSTNPFFFDVATVDVAAEFKTTDSDYPFAVNVVIDKASGRIDSITATYSSETNENIVNTSVSVSFTAYGEVAEVVIPEEAYQGKDLTATN